MPWRGPQQKGEYPTTGYLIGDWIEENLPIPDGQKMGQPFKLTSEMWRFVLRLHRLRPDAREEDGTDGYVYSGGQLVRPQKWGKDPLAAALDIAHALGPVIPAGWDGRGEPVAMEHPSPWVAVAAVADAQTDNTFRPIVSMLLNGALSDMAGLDIGETRIKLPGIGWIEPLPSNAWTRLGGRFTKVSITESGLLVGEGRTGGVTFGRVLKRNVGGMGGMWVEITNPWDPTEMSLAQRTYEAKAPDVLIDYRLPRRQVSLDDPVALKREVIYLYGDSARSKGGWVSENRIVREIQNPASGENEVRRFFLQEIIAGGGSAIDDARWDALARTDDPLRPGEPIGVGFDGSRSRDATAVRISRIRDGRLFHGRVWVPADYDDGLVPRRDVDGYMTALFAAYDVRFVFADPYRWQDYLDIWAGRWPGRVVEFPTNVETRMDRAITRFLTRYRTAELTHDGNALSTQHARNAALAKGKRKQGREGEVEGANEYYLLVTKKRKGLLIDDFVAGILADEARAKAIEDGALVPDPSPSPATVSVAAPGGNNNDLFRPSSRLRI